MKVAYPSVLRESYIFVFITRSISPPPGFFFPWLMVMANSTGSADNRRCLLRRARWQRHTINECGYIGESGEERGGHGLHGRSPLYSRPDLQYRKRDYRWCKLYRSSERAKVGDKLLTIAGMLLRRSLPPVPKVTNVTSSRTGYSRTATRRTHFVRMVTTQLTTRRTARHTASGRSNSS